MNEDNIEKKVKKKGNSKNVNNILVLRIAGQVKNKIKDNETLARLNLEKKFSCRIVKSDDAVRKGMVHSVSHKVAYGKVSEDFIKELEKKRKANSKGVYFLHPPRGGFKKSSKVATPKGILGKHEDITKLVGRML